MRDDPVIIIGAGMGGLSAAIALASRGVPVTLFERAANPGGKMRQLAIGGQKLDAGPTVFTMRWIFDALFDEAGERLEDWVSLTRADILARHAWEDGSVLDLHADPLRTEAAIADFAGDAALTGFRRFRSEARDLFEAMNPRFIEAAQAGPVEMTRRFPPALIARLLTTGPSATLWQRLGRHFADGRLRQLFARYATYCGSSPFQAPSLLSLVAHVEAEGVWLVSGGLHMLARQMRVLAGRLGVVTHFDADVREIIVDGGAARGVRLADGTECGASAVLFNGDVAALGDALLGEDARKAAPAVHPKRRSLSALVWSAVAETRGLALSRHTVIFPDAYKPEFDAIFKENRMPDAPTVYICAQDRGGAPDVAPTGPERLHIHVNAPATGDRQTMTQQEIDRCTQQMTALAARAGLEIQLDPTRTTITTPQHFNTLFPATGGALYGRANHGMMASFQRMGSASHLPGLYLAGGSVHPGPGIPMAAMSGRLAAAQILADLPTLAASAPGSTRRSRRGDTSGGMSTGSAPTDASA